MLLYTWYSSSFTFCSLGGWIMKTIDRKALRLLAITVVLSILGHFRVLCRRQYMDWIRSNRGILHTDRRNGWPFTVHVYWAPCERLDGAAVLRNLRQDHWRVVGDVLRLRSPCGICIRAALCSCVLCGPDWLSWRQSEDDGFVDSVRRQPISDVWLCSLWHNGT